MPKLPRVTAKIFASKADANDIGQYGSALTGTKILTSDITEIQALPAYETGWRGAVISNRNYPTLQEMNGLQKTFSQQIAYTLQAGVPEYDTNTTYYIGSIVKTLDENNKPVLYYSVIDDNLGNPLTDTEKWAPLELGGSGLELCDIGMALYIDETKGLRRRLNGQIVDINSNTQPFLNRLLEIKALYPSLFTTEENWQAAKTLSPLGQVGQFVLNYAQDNQTVESVRIPAIINIQGLFDLQNLGLTVAAGLPNITGEFWGYPTNKSGETGANGAFTFKALTTKDCNIIGSQNYRNRESFDASLSNPIYGNSDTVQPEAVQYPYFIQVATGVEESVDVTREIELNNPFFFGMSAYFETTPDNLSWLKSTGQWNAKSIYPSYYDWLLSVYNGTVSTEGVSVKLSTATDITDYDFVLNTADETFRLPLKTKLASGNAVVGNGRTLGITNGATNYGLKHHTGGDYSYLQGVVQMYGTAIGTTDTSGTPAANNKTMGVTTDPSKSGLELSNAGLYLYYYVGETVQNANLINAGRLAEELANKTDAKQAAIASMPSTRSVDLTLGPQSGQQYTMPDWGYLYVQIYDITIVGYMAFDNLTQNVFLEQWAKQTASAIAILMPVAKNDVVNVRYNLTGKIRFKFIYAEGVKND